MVLAFAAAGICQVAKSNDDEDGENNGDDDAAGVDGLFFHANVVVGAVDGADPAGETVA